MSSNGVRSGAALIFALTLVASGRAAAQTPAPSPPYDAPAFPAENPAPLPPPAHLEAPPRPVEPPLVLETAPRSPRPRLNVALGMGATFESSGLSPARTALVPAFFATGGVGDDWPVGVEGAVFASSASGRFKAPDAPVDRLAFAVIGVLRPCIWSFDADDARYGTRVARTVAFELGLGIERDGTTIRAGSRVALQAGARVELPLSASPSSKELRLRLAARRMQGFYTPRIGDVDVGDGLELYAALVSAF